MINKYDMLIVGAGLFGAIVARELTDLGLKVLVIDKRNHIAGNCHTSLQEGILVHEYGAHIFRSNSDEVWYYLNRFTEFSDYRHIVLANYKGTMYNLPFNMHTFYQIWGTKTPEEAKKKLESEKKFYFRENPKNLEEQAINLVGKDIYEKLIKGYSEKQWGRKATEIPAEIITRIPVRFTYDNDYYFGEKYQGIPIKGYTDMVNNMLDGIDVLIETEYKEFVKTHNLDEKSLKILFTGPIDYFFDYKYGKLDYRSLKFEHTIYPIESFQGTSVVNYTDAETPYTRIIEHKHFDKNNKSKHTIVTKEYSINDGEEYYPINDEYNNSLYEKYKQDASKYKNLYFGGRLGEYKYYDMNSTVLSALEFVKNYKKENNL